MGIAIPSYKFGDEVSISLLYSEAINVCIISERLQQ